MVRKLLALLLALTLCFAVLPVAVQAATKTGDSNGDGSVTVMDATLIQYYVAELISGCRYRRRRRDYHSGRDPYSACGCRARSF